MIDYFLSGGPVGMLAIAVCGFTAIIGGVLAFIRFGKIGSVSKLQLDSILFFGSLSFFIGLLWQIIGMFEVLSIIQEIGDISPQLIAAGVAASMIGLKLGTILALISLLMWYTLRFMNSKAAKA